MAEEITLIEFIRRIDSFEQSDLIYLSTPFAHHSSVELFPEEKEDEVEDLPQQRNGRRFFMDVFVAADFIEQLRQTNPEWSLEQLCDRLIHYGIYNA